MVKLFSLAGLGLLGAALLGGCERKQAERPAAAPPEVQVTTVQPREVPLFNEYVGATEGLVNANIQARVSGYLISQDYKEGTALKKGDLLFQIDPRPFEAALTKAKADLAEAEASQKQLELTAQRNVELFERKAVSAQERDNAVQQERAAAAQVQAQKAQVEQAQLDLEFTRITAPIDGVAGIAKAQVGDLVGPSTGVLTSISTVDPIKVYFTISEQRYTQYMKQYNEAEQRAVHEKELQFTLVLADGTTYGQKGEFFARDREIDPRTGSFRLAAVFPNPGSVLRPGQFARVRVQTELRKGALLVPQRAVTELQGLFQLAVVNAKNEVSIRPVVTGARIGSDWLIEKGLSANEQIVVEGVQKVRDGMVVAPKPWVPTVAKSVLGETAADTPTNAPPDSPAAAPAAPAATPSAAPADR